MKKYTCLYCKKTFFAYKNAGGQNRKFCSKRCYGRFKEGKLGIKRVKKTQYKCKCCRRIFYDYKSVNGRAGRKFCSLGCSTKYHNKKRFLKRADIKFRICGLCNKWFKRNKTEKYCEFLQRKYCSRKCHLLSDSYNLAGIKGYKAFRRGKSTSIEKKMLQKLKDANLIKGKDFLCQYPMHNRFIVDFYLPDSDIVLEVDGRYWHSSEKQQKRDRARDAYLTTCGHKVIRVWEDEIEDFDLNALTN